MAVRWYLRYGLSYRDGPEPALAQLPTLDDILAGYPVLAAARVGPATKAGLAFTALPNGFADCKDPAALQAICGRLGAGPSGAAAAATGTAAGKRRRP